MSHGWTTERRAQQAEAIRRWKPWEASTGPRTAEGKRRASRNAWKGGERPLLRKLARVLWEQHAHPHSPLISTRRETVTCLRRG